MFLRIRAFLSSIILFLVGLILIFALVFCMRTYFNEQSVDIPIHKVATSEKEISLTFDVSYSERNVEKILSVLDKHDVKATFFVVGNWIDKNRELVKEIDKRGHEIQNHSYTHQHFNDISEEDIKTELESTSKKIEEITGKKTTLFRPPFGELDENRVKICESLGYKIIKWDVDSMDWKNISDNNIVERVAQNTSSGSIILFHGDGKNVESYLEQIICYFEKNGYNMVQVSELVYEDNYYVDSLGVQRLKKEFKK